MKSIVASEDEPEVDVYVPISDEGPGAVFVTSQVVDGQWSYQINDRFSQQNRASEVPEPGTCVLTLSSLSLLLLRRQRGSTKVPPQIA